MEYGHEIHDVECKRFVYLAKIGWGGVDWIGPVQDRDKWRVLVNVVRNLRVPYTAGKLLSACTTGVLSSSAPLQV
jgi:hypothetical protein